MANAPKSKTAKPRGGTAEVPLAVKAKAKIEAHGRAKVIEASKRKVRAEASKLSLKARAELPEVARELANYRKLVDRVVDAFGDEIKASQWLSLPNSELNGETPLQTAQRNGYDAQVLEPILTRIEHGIYF